MKILVKVCGLTCVTEAVAVVCSGANAVGLVFVKSSKRFVTDEVARAIIKALPSIVSVVGLAMDPDDDEWVRLRKRAIDLPINLWQFHGHESAAVLAKWTTPFIKAIRVSSSLAGEILLSPNPNDYINLPLCRGFLLDSGAGDGKAMPWQLLAKHLELLKRDNDAVELGNDFWLKKAFMLAGGLSAKNVGEAIATMSPWINAVDVSSGVEEQLGKKSDYLVGKFVYAVNTK